MTRGISEERLRELLKQSEKNNHGGLYSALFFLITNECTDLNPWMPVESAPIGRVLRLYSDGTEPSFGKGQSTGKLYHESDRKYFSHFCELPDDPK